jgi:hypothetical protein
MTSWYIYVSYEIVDQLQICIPNHMLDKKMSCLTLSLSSLIVILITVTSACVTSNLARSPSICHLYQEYKLTSHTCGQKLKIVRRKYAIFSIVIL